MNDEVKAAAERYKQAQHGLMSDTYTATPFPSAFYASDQRTLAKAYLSEHPIDDDEPITAEWLAELGEVDFLEQFFNGKFRPKLIFRAGTIQLPPDRTRGDVRRLCTALGIEVKQ